MALIYHTHHAAGTSSGASHAARQCFRGRRELRAYAERCDLALGDSEFNRRDLEDLGFRARQCPVVRIFSPRAHPEPHDGSVHDDGWTNVVFVGRVIATRRSKI
jgi:hypothetical protein